jgi:predicted RNA-binding protein YlxR (DUF448 family)
MLYARSIAEKFNQEENALQRLYANRWDKEKQAWLPPTGLKASVQKTLRRLIGRPAWVSPSITDLEQYIKKSIIVEPMDTKALFKMKIRTDDPQTGYWLLNGVFNAAQSVFKEAEITKQQGRADYVLDVLQTVTDINQRRSLISILDSLQMQLVIANTKEPIALDILQSASIPDVPVGPRLGMTLVLSIILGMFVGGVVIFVSYIRQQPKITE